MAKGLYAVGQRYPAVSGRELAGDFLTISVTRITRKPAIVDDRVDPRDAGHPSWIGNAPVAVLGVQVQ
jgi:hypothetical protein